MFKIYIIPALIMQYKRAEISKQRTFLEIFNPLYIYECAATFIIIKIYVIRVLRLQKQSKTLNQMLEL